MLSLALVAVCAVVFSFINVFYLVFVLSGLLCSLVLWLGYAKGANKAELSVYLTILYALCTAAVLYLIGAKEIGSYAFADVLQYYRDFFNGIFDEMLEQMKLSFADFDWASAGVDEVTFYDMLKEYFALISNLFLSMLIVVSFLYSGIQIKIFTAIMNRCEKEPRERKTWHFALSNVFAYFYIALVLLSAFMGYGNSVVGIAAINLYIVFMFVFAYIGFNYALYFTSRMKKKALARFIFVAILVTTNMAALQILSFVGVFVTTMHNKFLKMNSDESDSSQE